MNKKQQKFFKISKFSCVGLNCKFGISFAEVKANEFYKVLDMSQGIAAVTQGMAAAEQITANIGINLSNANTPGYKAFDDFLVSETSKYNGGVSATYRTKIDHQGSIVETKNEFDYAIEGRGLLVVQCNAEERYTNAGHFGVDKNSYLYGPNGCYLMGEKYKADEKQKQSITPTSENFGKIKVPLNDYIKGNPTTEATVYAKLSATQAITTITASPSTAGQYSPNDKDYNMAGGKVAADYKREFIVFDSIGQRYSVFAAFKRTDADKYTVEIYANKDELSTSRSDGLIAAGTIKFKTDGKFEKTETITPLTDAVAIDSSITFNWEKNSLKSTTTMMINWENIEMFGSEFYGDVETNGTAEGALMSTSVDDKGNLVGHYTNGAQKLIAAIPVVLFKDPYELQNEFGTVFSSTPKSGDPEYVISGDEGAGKIVSGSLESSNVDSTQSMTNLMSQQRFYSYNAKAYGIMNGMENELLNVIRV